MSTNLISGLIKRRGELHREQHAIRDREAEIYLDIDALDRTLRGLGYEGDLEAATPKKRRKDAYKRGELSRACMKVVRESERPLTTRGVSEAALLGCGETLTHIRMNTFAKACGKSMRTLAARGRLTKGENVDGEVVWESVV